VVASSALRRGLILSAVLDTGPDRAGHRLAGLMIEPDTGAPEGLFHVAIGSNRIRHDIVTARPNAGWVTIIDPAAILAGDVEIGEGSLIGMGACVQAGARIGRHAIVNTGAIVEHDCVVGDFAHVAPGAVLTGGVRIGEGGLVGAGAVILPGIQIGDWATVGAGAVVTRPVAADHVVTGSPARALELPLPQDRS